MVKLINSLENCTKLKRLDLSDNYLKSDAIEALIKLIKGNKNLVELGIADCNITEEDSEKLSECLK